MYASGSASNALAARRLTVQDVETALRAQTMQVPAGCVQSEERDYQVRVARTFEDAGAVPAHAAARRAADDAAVVRLGDVARVEMGAGGDATHFPRQWR
ncbi:MAG: efflux RND transporter permease subunit [Hyphomonadaceae bacterium]